MKTLACIISSLFCLSGVGILSIPYALSQGGWLSLILLFLVAILCWYTGLLLRRCMDAHPLIKTYPDVGELAFGMKGRTMIALFMYLELYLVAVEFLILEGDNLEKLFPTMSFKVAGLKIGGRQGFVLLAALVILPTTWLRSLGLLAYLSAGGVFASVIVVGCVFWAGAVDGVGFHERGMVLNWSGLPTTISLFVFCYCGHAIFPTLCTSMKDKSQFSKVKDDFFFFFFVILLIQKKRMPCSTSRKFIFLVCSVVAGSTNLLCSKHNQLWINGHSRLPDVWRKSEVSSDSKSSNGKNEFQTSNIYNTNQSPDQVWDNNYSNCQCY